MAKQLDTAMEGASWGMIIDESRCIGCNSCVVGCKLQNNTAENKFNTRIDETETGSYPRPAVSFNPSLCHHCFDAPCVSNCPTKAAYYHASGIVLSDWNLCNACGTCIEACPYDARFHDIRFDNRVDKCNFCIDRLQQGLKPACVENCSSEARIFGRFDKPEGEFAAYLYKMKINGPENRNGAVIFYSREDRGPAL